MAGYAVAVGWLVVVGFLAFLLAGYLTLHIIKRSPMRTLPLFVAILIFVSCSALGVTILLLEQSSVNPGSIICMVSGAMLVALLVFAGYSISAKIWNEVGLRQISRGRKGTTLLKITHGPTEPTWEAHLHLFQ